MSYPPLESTGPVSTVGVHRRPADVTVLIPAVTPLDEPLAAGGHGPSPAMVSLRGRPVIQSTVEYLRGLGFSHFVIALRRDDVKLHRFAGWAFGATEDIEIVRVEGTSRHAALIELLDRVRGEHALVAPAGIHFRLPPTAFDREGSFAITGPAGGKDHERVLWIADAARLREDLLDESDVALALDRGAGGELARVEAIEWIDCGRLDQIERAGSRTSQARAFNRIAVDATLGTITKTSEHREKLRDEIDYYTRLPSELAVLFPRVIRSDACGERPFLELEYYGYPTLARLFVYEGMDERVWKRVLEHVASIHDAMGQYRRAPDPSAARSMYVDKVERRVAALARGSTACREIIESDAPVVINGRPCRSFDGAWPDLRRRLENIAATAEMRIVHGDLCFSNVLYDVGEGICRLIDPRGSFGQRGIWGDPRYDAAKLWHSSHGLYDFVVADLFDVERTTGGWRLDIHSDPAAGAVHRVLERITLERHDRGDVLAIEGALFLSMGALHADHPRRQIAMTLRGLEIWDELVRNDAPVAAGGR